MTAAPFKQTSVRPVIVTSEPDAAAASFAAMAGGPDASSP